MNSYTWIDWFRPERNMKSGLTSWRWNSNSGKLECKLFIFGVGDGKNKDFFLIWQNKVWFICFVSFHLTLFTRDAKWTINVAKYQQPTNSICKLFNLTVKMYSYNCTVHYGIARPYQKLLLAGMMNIEIRCWLTV